MSQDDFSTLSLPSELLQNVAALGYQQMTPIQARSLPFILEGKDVVGQGKTGSGKTAAFALGVLSKLDVKQFDVQSLILCPTRELADQVANEVRKLGRSIHNIKVLTLCGGVALSPQANSLEHGAHIIVGTPGRVEDHVKRGTLKLNRVTTLVLDEADRMLEMGFQPALETIISKLPKQRQTLLFSATFPQNIEALTTQIMQQATIVRLGETHDNSSIEQHFYKVDENARARSIRLLLMHFKPQSSVIFCNTKIETQQVADELSSHGFGVLALHGDLEQRERDKTLVRFANKSASILVATDVAARGLDIDSLDAVFNYQIARELEVHVHRVGRTGRAGSSGVACTLYTENEQYKLDLLGKYLKTELANESLPPKNVLDEQILRPEMITIEISAGRKQKVRPGDILGALTGDNGISGSDVGKIQITDFCAYVAVKRSAIQNALNKLSNGKIKGRNFRVRSL